MINYIQSDTQMYQITQDHLQTKKAAPSGTAFQ